MADLNFPAAPVLNDTHSEGGRTWVYKTSPNRWDLVASDAGVTSVNGATGVVVLDADDIDDAATTHKFATATSVAAAGAVMESDTTTALMSFVVDEDSMTSNSATKLPTQQSVKAYADTKGVGRSSSFVVAASDAPAAVKARADYVCDGTADEVQINTALALGSVQLTDGTFVVDAPVKVGLWGQTFCGAGMRAAGSLSGLGSGAAKAGTVIQASASFVGDAVVQCENIADEHILGRVHVYGFSIDGSLSSATFDGIRFRSFMGSLHDIYVSQCGQDGIALIGNESPNAAWSPYDTRVYSVVSYDNDRDGLNYGNNAADTHVTNSIFAENGRHGIGMYGGASQQITQVHCYGNVTNGIRFDAGAGSRTKIANCKIEHSGEHGILFNGSSNPASVQIVGCSFGTNGETTNNTYDHIGSSGAGSVDLLKVVGCDFSSPDSPTNIARYCINMSTIVNSAVIAGNTFPSAAYTTSAINITAGNTPWDTARIVGNVGVADFFGADSVTFTMGAGAGGSPPAAVGAAGNVNRRGGVTWGTGTSPTTGTQVTVNFATAELVASGATSPARVMITPRNSATAALNPFVSAITQSSNNTVSFAISLATAPAASQANTTYAIDWILVP